MKLCKKLSPREVSWLVHHFSALVTELGLNFLKACLKTDTFVNSCCMSTILPGPFCMISHLIHAGYPLGDTAFSCISTVQEIAVEIMALSVWVSVVLVRGGVKIQIYIRFQGLCSYLWCFISIYSIPRNGPLR